MAISVVITLIILLVHFWLFRVNQKYHDKIKELIRKPGFIIAILCFFALLYILPFLLYFIIFWGVAEGFH